MIKRAIYEMVDKISDEKRLIKIYKFIRHIYLND